MRTLYHLRSHVRYTGYEMGTLLNSLTLFMRAKMPWTCDSASVLSLLSPQFQSLTTFSIWHRRFNLIQFTVPLHCPIYWWWSTWEMLCIHKKILENEKWWQKIMLSSVGFKGNISDDSNSLTNTKRKLCKKSMFFRIFWQTHTNQAKRHKEKFSGTQ